MMEEVKLVGSEIVKKKYTGTEIKEGVPHYNWVNYASFCDSSTARNVLNRINGVLVKEVCC